MKGMRKRAKAKTRHSFQQLFKHTEKRWYVVREKRGKGNEREGLCLQRNEIPRNDEEEEGME